jgi:hypothetical protein
MEPLWSCFSPQIPIFAPSYFLFSPLLFPVFAPISCFLPLFLVFAPSYFLFSSLPIFLLLPLFPVFAPSYILFFTLFPVFASHNYFLFSSLFPVFGPLSSTSSNGWSRTLKVPKCEIFERSDFPDFYTIKSRREGDFGVKIKKS